MDAKTPSDVLDEKPEDRMPWHKPEVQRITVSLDTALGGSSTVDGIGGLGFLTPSDRRLKQDVSGIGDALSGILALQGLEDLPQVYPQVVAIRNDGSKAVNYALLVPVLVEAIKQQQSMIEDLQAQVKELR